MLKGRIMGLDVGDATIGVALSDMMGITAQGLTTIKRIGKKKDIEALKKIIADNNVYMIVSGLPKNMNGSIGEQAEKVMKFCDLVKEETGLEIEFFDERLSTVSADRMLGFGEVKAKNRKKVIDKVAASIILQTYLDSKGFSL